MLIIPDSELNDAAKRILEGCPADKDINIIENYHSIACRSRHNNDKNDISLEEKCFMTRVDWLYEKWSDILKHAEEAFDNGEAFDDDYCREIADETQEVLIPAQKGDSIKRYNLKILLKMHEFALFPGYVDENLNDCQGLIFDILEFYQ